MKPLRYTEYYYNRGNTLRYYVAQRKKINWVQC